MGLGLYVNGRRVAQWSYSGFNSFRRKLAAQIGIDLERMEGFGPKPEFFAGMPNLDDVLAGRAEVPAPEEMARMREEAERRFRESRGTISWDTVDDPIKLLLRHSDCGGALTPGECARIGPRLAEMIKDWPETVTVATGQWPGYPEQMTLPDHDSSNARGLVAGLLEAWSTGSPLEFR